MVASCCWNQTFQFIRDSAYAHNSPLPRNQLFHAKWHQDADRQQTHDVDNRSEARVCGEHPPRAHPAECDDCREEALHGRSVPLQTTNFKNNQGTFLVVIVTLVLPGVGFPPTEIPPSAQAFDSLLLFF